MKSKISFLEPKDDFQFLKLVCQVSKYDLERAMTMLNNRLGLKARKDRIHRFSYLSGLIAGAMINKLKPRCLEKDIPALLEVYGRDRNGKDGKPIA